MALENLQVLCYAIITPLFFFGTLSIILRLYARCRIVRAFGWDDWAMVGVLVINTVQQAILYIFIHYGGGKHATVVSKPDLANLIKWLFVEEIHYMLTHWSIKMAFLLFYLRLSQSRIFRRWVYGTMVLNTVFAITNWMIVCLQCTPLAAFFNRAAYPEAKCISQFVTFFVPAFLNIFTDVLILILPVRTVWNLQMTVRRKIALMVVVGFGAASCLVSMLRLIVLHQFYVNPDFPFILGKMIIISCFEIQVAVIAANMPSMKTLWMARFKEGCLAYGSSGHPSGGAYKLSSMEPPPGKSGGHRHKSNQPMGVRGSVSGLDLSGRDTEPGPNNESLEELFGKDSRIMVTTDIAVNKTAKTMADDAERDADAFTLYGTQKRPQ